MGRPADWWAAGGVRHAFPIGRFPFRSFCGEARWSSRVTRDYEAPECPACVEAMAGEEPGPLMQTAPAPIDPALKKHIYGHRRRWNGTTHP